MANDIKTNVGVSFMQGLYIEKNVLVHVIQDFRMLVLSGVFVSCMNDVWIESGGNVGLELGWFWELFAQETTWGQGESSIARGGLLEIDYSDSNNVKFNSFCPYHI